MRYHLNPRTGNPGLCKAQQSCPFGDLEKDHYESKEAARKAFEERFQGSLEHLQSLTMVPLSKPLAPADLPTLLTRMEEEGFLQSPRQRQEAEYELLNPRPGFC